MAYLRDADGPGILHQVNYGIIYRSVIYAYEATDHAK